MRFIFRADASREIGSGHVMRSSVLAEEAISRGYECYFVGEIKDLEWVQKKVENLGYVQLLSTTDSFAYDCNNDVLILDSYSIPVSDPFINMKNWKFVMCIRDEFSPNYEARVELRPGFGVVHSGSDSRMILSGADHILIRKGISKSRKEISDGSVVKVLLVGGGSDPFGFVTAIADVIGEMDLNLDVHAFTDGSLPKWSNVHFVKHPIGSELDLIANDFDIVFTTASTTCLEFIAREIPTGVVCAVENQVDYYHQLGELGYVSRVGIYNSDSKWELDSLIIKDLLETQTKRNSLKESIHSLIDLKGAARVIDTLLSLA
jgi:spore coat polysaccharide biosynthesis predicted glycosyltransferase SpsG